MVFADKMHDIINVLENGGIILYDSGVSMEIACSFNNNQAVSLFSSITNKFAKMQMVLLTTSITMTKNYIKRMHPRIETLLYYHTRPLTIVYPNPKNLPKVLSAENKIAIRISNDPFTKTIVDLLGNPIFSSAIRNEYNDLVPFRDEVPEFILDHIHYECKHKIKLEEYSFPSVIASYDKNGELMFEED